MRLQKQIEKAASHNDDAVVAVMKEVKRLLKNFEKDLPSVKTSGIIEKDWDEDAHPRDERGRFSNSGGGSDDDSEGTLSPQGENKFSVRGFRSAQKLNNHWKDHMEDYKNDEQVSSKEAYLKRALSLLESPTGKNIVGHTDGRGEVIRYNKATNEFAKGNPSRGVTTLFKPDTGISYYNNQLEEDIKHGGKA